MIRMIFMKMYMLIAVTLFLFGCGSENNNTIKEPVLFSDFIDELQQLDQTERESSYYLKRDALFPTLSFPSAQGNVAYFIYESREAQEVEIVGDVTYWKTPGIKMTRLEGTPLFYKAVNLEKNARVKYKFIVDGKQLSDPLNANIEHSVFSNDSVFTMNGYAYPETAYYKNIAHGEVVEKQIENNTIFATPADQRKIIIYLPPAYSHNESYKTIYFGDGSDYAYQSNIINVLDYMIDKKELEPVIAVFVDPLARDGEYILKTKSAYLEFMVNELIPMIDTDYSTIASAEGRVMVGASNGGDFTTYVGTEVPYLFMYLFNQSGSPQYYTDFSRGDPFGDKYKSENLPVKVLSIVGKYEKEYNRDNARNFHNDMRSNPSILAEKLIFYPQGHTWRMWGDSFREGILWLLYGE